MNSRQRLLHALNHEEPDRVPVDLGATQLTGISVTAYESLRDYLGLPPEEPNFTDKNQQIVDPAQDILDRFNVDVRGVWPLISSSYDYPQHEEGEFLVHTDEWGFKYRIKKEGGLWYDMFQSPLEDGSLTPERIDNHSWPRGGDPARFAGLREQAENFRGEGYAVSMRSVCAGLLEISVRLRGMQNFLMEMLTQRKAAEHLLDKILEIKLDYWDTALDELGDVLDVLVEADDFGTQIGPLISPDMFRSLIKPRQAELIQFMKKKAPAAHIFFHSCGNVRDILPDFIEMGIDILNPVHFKAEGMDPAALKRDFGDDITFWGGGIDTQDTLPKGTPQQVRDEVKRQVEILGDGGGFVFTPVHNIQADVPPENIVAMYDALQEYGQYEEPAVS